MKKSLVTTSIILALSVSGLTGCESVTKVTGTIGNTFSTIAGRGIITKEKSDFDNKMAVRMTPDDLIPTSKNNGRKYLLGALWNESSPNNVVLIVSVDARRSTGTSGVGLGGLLGSKQVTFQGINLMDANIDGKILSYSSKSESELTKYSFSKDVNGSSFFEIPTSTLNALLKGKDSRVRFKGGITEDNFQFSSAQDITGTRTAIVGLKTFLDAVDDIKRGDRSVGNRVAGQEKNSAVATAVAGDGVQKTAEAVVDDAQAPSATNPSTKATSSTKKTVPTKKKKK